LLHQWQGLEACLWCSAILVILTAALSRSLPSVRRDARSVAPAAG
jgi:hypothetical protein